MNLGLRYDFMTPPYEADNQMANFDPTANGGAGGLVFASDGSLEDRALVKPDKNNFAPRIGVVYKLGERTILRGGYGVVLQPVRAHRIGGSARAQPAGAAQHRHQRRRPARRRRCCSCATASRPTSSIGWSSAT